MEVKANHVLIGAFTIATVLAAFIFLVWLGQFSFERRFDDYQIYFQGGVSGLGPASEVRYSGIKVGEVSDVSLDKDDPRRVKVIIRLEAGTPVKEDTVAAIEAGLLTGVGIVQLSGGSPESPALTAKEGQHLPVIPARLTGLQELTETAPNLLASAASFLARGNALLSDKNRAAVAETLENARQFSTRLDAVMANIEKASVRLDSITENLDKVMVDASKSLGPALASVQTAGAGITDVAEDLDQLLSDVRPSFRDFARGGLTAFVAFIQEARQLTATLERVLSRIESDPSGFLTGNDAPEYKGGK
ncbi:MAG: MCE family protein [Alphaproteobacteria bacterium]|nr:MCE family protein [Alphaproteobacteria bacterium]